MKKCFECKGNMIKKTAKTLEGFDYKYFDYNKCGEEIVDMKQLH